MDRSRSLRRPIAPMTLWLVRLAWASLPLTAGPAAGDALADWSTPPRTLAEVLLWTAWAISLIALFAPHPIGLTVLRVVASTFVALAVVVTAGDSADAARAAVALVATVVAGALVVVLPAVSFACANAIAYGDERRYPLRTPPVLWLGVLPLAPLLVVAGIAAGPLLLADGRVGAGARSQARRARRLGGDAARPADGVAADTARAAQLRRSTHGGDLLRDGV